MSRTNIQTGKRKSTLLRYKKIMEEFEKHDHRIIPITVIWREYIYPKFYISRETLYKIFQVSIEEELEAINSKSRQIDGF